MTIRMMMTTARPTNRTRSSPLMSFASIVSVSEGSQTKSFTAAEFRKMLNSSTSWALAHSGAHLTGWPIPKHKPAFMRWGYCVNSPSERTRIAGDMPFRRSRRNALNSAGCDHSASVVQGLAHRRNEHCDSLSFARHGTLGSVRPGRRHRACGGVVLVMIL